MTPVFAPVFAVVYYFLRLAMPGLRSGVTLSLCLVLSTFPVLTFIQESLTNVWPFRSLVFSCFFDGLSVGSDQQVEAFRRERLVVMSTANCHSLVLYT